MQPQLWLELVVRGQAQALAGQRLREAVAAVVDHLVAQHQRVAQVVVVRGLQAELAHQERLT
jgi:hypothetical protein